LADPSARYHEEGHGLRSEGRPSLKKFLDQTKRQGKRCETTGVENNNRKRRIWRLKILSFAAIGAGLRSSWRNKWIGAELVKRNAPRPHDWRTTPRWSWEKQKKDWTRKSREGRLRDRKGFLINAQRGNSDIAGCLPAKKDMDPSLP